MTCLNYYGKYCEIWLGKIVELIMKIADVLLKMIGFSANSFNEEQYYTDIKESPPENSGGLICCVENK
jgi:hypothetical protein